MNKISLKIYKDPKIYLLGSVILLLFLPTLFLVPKLFFYEIQSKFLFKKILIILFFLTGIITGLLFFIINLEKVFSKDGVCNTSVLCLNKKIFSFSSEHISPKYISVYPQRFSESHNYSQNVNIDTKTVLYVIRFFDENNRNELVFKTKNKAEVLEKGKQLAELLNVDLLNKLED